MSEPLTIWRHESMDCYRVSEPNFAHGGPVRVVRLEDASAALRERDREYQALRNADNRLQREYDQLVALVQSVLSSLPFSAPENVATIVQAKLGWVATASDDGETAA